MKTMIRNLMIILASVFAIGAAQAENDGGLRAQMMAKRFPPKMITTTPAVQACLAQVKLPAELHRNGGLMNEMLGDRYPGKIITNEDVQNVLALVKIPRGSGGGYGGLRTEIQRSEINQSQPNPNFYVAGNLIDTGHTGSVRAVQSNICG